MVKRSFSIALLALTAAIFPITLGAQEQTPQEPQPAKTEQPILAQHEQPKRNLWIAKFTADTKAAAAVASIQTSDASALKYSSLFDTVQTFESNPTQPAGTWTLAGKELDFSGGSAATRALVGLGAGRAHITMEYTLSDADGKAVWTQKITTKPSFWGAAGAMGAVQNQGQAMDQQGQKLIDALSRFLPPRRPENSAVVRNAGLRMIGSNCAGEVS